MPKTGEEILQWIKEKRGIIYPTHEFLAKYDPEYLEIEENMVMGVLYRARTINRKMAELTVMAINAALAYERGVKTHMNRAFDEGATIEEVLEALEIASAVRSHGLTVGVAVMREVLAERPELAERFGK